MDFFGLNLFSVLAPAILLVLGLLGLALFSDVLQLFKRGVQLIAGHDDLLCRAKCKKQSATMSTPSTFNFL